MATVAMDPILVEVWANRLISIVNEQQAVLVRTAFSTVVRGPAIIEERESTLVVGPEHEGLVTPDGNVVISLLAKGDVG
jgi:N-methylhydantoinase B/oxoprolinase/acetone carboxylase alpha subunit